jgi:predicted DNA-binding transcriptional regulator YafY
MNRVDRLLALILFLQSRRVVTAEQMAEHFELSVRTIYRDLAALGQAGVPIVAEAGVGYTLMRGYHLPPVNFTTEEASALVTGGLLVEQFADAVVKAQMHSALLKVRAVLPRDHQERITRLERGLATTANVKTPAQADLSLLQQALANLQVLSFSYQSAGKASTTERITEPCGLIHYLERWHLIAWCRATRDYRDFRTDRMTNVTALRETFSPREDFSVAQYIRAMPTPTLRARVKFTPLAADRAKREWWLGVVDEVRVSGGIALTLATVEWESLVRWLLSFEREVTVLTPESLRKTLVKAAESAAAHHAKKPACQVS